MGGNRNVKPSEKWRRRPDSNRLIEGLETSPLTTWVRRPDVPAGVPALKLLAGPRGFEPRFTDPKSAVLPLDEGPAGMACARPVYVPGGREWSGRRDSNPRPSPWQGDALPTEPLPLDDARPSHPRGGAESQDRTGDTAIFSRVLYQLSYLGPST